MKKFLFAVLLSLVSAAAASAQGAPATPSASPRPVSTITVAEKNNSASPTAPAKRGPVFRPTKDQIKQVQAMLKDKSLYKGEATGSYNDETRAAIRSFQKDNGLKETGTLNRATLEKMNVALTDSQKLIPASESSLAGDSGKKAADTAAPSDSKAKRGPIFRATADQVKEAQKLLKAKSMYAGEETGKLDDDTRAGLRKYQSANSLNVTGTLNQATLESMGIALNDKQKAASQSNK